MSVFAAFKEITTSKSLHGEFVEGVFVGLGWGVDNVVEGESGGVNIAASATCDCLLNNRRLSCGVQRL